MKSTEAPDPFFTRGTRFEPKAYYNTSRQLLNFIPKKFHNKHQTQIIKHKLIKIVVDNFTKIITLYYNLLCNMM